ncbi:MAG: undecaprenyl-diphosphatase UppP [bacterium]|nr:undecaprenyl-diphosphatase UppP [bacterium]
MSFFQSILLGTVQGLTEFFPVSSSGHLVIIESFFKNFDRPGLLFEIFLHLGTLLAIFTYYRRQIAQMVEGLFRWKSDSLSSRSTQRGRKVLLMIVLGSVPTAIIGFAFKDLFEQTFSAPSLVLVALGLTGGLLWLASRRMPTTSRKLEEMTIRDALLIGLFQGLAITPGISRSGTTIAMGIFCGLEPSACVEYSFLLSIPAILGATILEGKDSLYLFWQPTTNLPAILAGTLAASVVGYLAIKYLVRLICQHRLSMFAWYCWLVALGSGLILFLTRT